MSHAVSTGWPAPAKLNLCLHIVGRRADGYHLLQTAFQFIGLVDEIDFSERPDGLIERVSGPAEIPAEQDLTVRAARLLAERTGCTRGIAIAVRKRIPIQGGLGGGSSNAATVLVALNEIWGLGLTEDQLAQWGLTLGADVPVFVRGRSAWAEGVGERLTPVEFPEAVYLVIRPDAAVGTAEVFQAAELTRNSPLTTIPGFLEGGGHNDCTPVVRKRYPQVAEALDWLQDFAEARLTGTGSCVFASFPGEAAAQRVLARMPGRWQGFVVRGMNRSPLLDRLRDEKART
ncbi:MAG: 4-(cytidine 5'-diphospho)-2-C-methyl-D-erythritol kinase [Steroidobacteraceae bacterium]